MDWRQKIVCLLSQTASLIAIEHELSKKQGRPKRKKSIHVREIFQKRKTLGWYHNLIREMHISSPAYFFNFTRMSGISFEKLVQLCGPYLLKKKAETTIEPGQRLIITLRYLATGDSYVSLAFGFRASPAVICNIVRETCEVIWHVLSPRVLNFPTKEQWLQIALDFLNLWQLPNCLGCIDGKHIRCKAPQHSGSTHFNYKKFFSLVLLAICDAQYFFTYINVGAHGSQSDGGILKNTEFGCRLENGTLNIGNGEVLPGNTVPVPFYFVADEAFPLGIHLMRPYSKSYQLMKEDELIFNYRLSRARRAIENAFGILTVRFQIFMKVIQAEVETINSIVKATTCLHNFIKLQKGDAQVYCPPGFADREQNGNVMPGQWRREIHNSIAFGNINDTHLRFGANNNAIREAFRFRDYLKDYVNGTGQVPWQWKQIRRTS